jgi:hypothetical protein
MAGENRITAVLRDPRYARLPSVHVAGGPVRTHIGFDFNVKLLQCAPLTAIGINGIL